MRMQNKYHKLPIPKKSGWEKRHIIPSKLRRIIKGIKNIIRWAPTIYKDQDWDDYYILKMLQKKIEHQRAHLVSENRHTGVDGINFWCTIALNLLEKEMDESYGMEYMDYMDEKLKFIPIEGTSSYSLKTELISEKWDDYLSIYPSTVRKLLKTNPSLKNNKQSLCFNVAKHNQQRCRKLLFDILETKGVEWWD